MEEKLVFDNTVFHHGTMVREQRFCGSVQKLSVGIADQMVLPVITNECKPFLLVPKIRDPIVDLKWFTK